jgi:hypothetical protein
MSKLEEMEPNDRIIRSINVTAGHWSSLKTICDKHGFKMSRIIDLALARWIRDKS